MASSKGLGITGEELLEVVPPEIVRFLMIKSQPNQAIEFEPKETDVIPNLYDAYQKAAQAYFSRSASGGEKGDKDLARVFELSQISEIKRPPSVRFSILTQWVQMPNMEEEIKKEGVEEWAKYARVWVERFAPEEQKFSVQKELPQEAKSLSEDQKKLLTEISNLLDQEQDAETYQTKIYEAGKALGLSGNQTFQAIYLSLIGKDHGPKAAWLILSLDPSFIRQRFEEAAK